MELYLLEVVINKKGVVLEYRMEQRKKDLRTNFCKKNDCFIKDPVKVIQAIAVFRPDVRGDRIILPNGEAAYKFHKMITD